MFSKKKCQKCARKISKEFDFCPYCGQDFRIEKRFKKERDFGLLGSDDNISSIGLSMPAGIGGIFQNLLKEVDKQFRELDREMTLPKEKPSDFAKLKQQAEQGRISGSGISISISTSSGAKPEIKVQTFGPEFKGTENRIKKEAKIENPKISDEKAKKLAKLPKKEADTTVRRLSNKIIYEIDMPDVTKIEDVIINKLENSIEVKAFSDNKAYFKLLPVNLPILDYKLKDGKLILELNPKN